VALTPSDAIVASLVLHVDEAVRSCCEPSEYVPRAVKLKPCPTLTVGVDGLTATELNVGVGGTTFVQVRPVVAKTMPYCTAICAVPAERQVKLSTEVRTGFPATATFDDDQFP
jgi:hypothetical protein